MRRAHRQIDHGSGFTLVEVLVVVAVMTIVLLSMVTMFRNQMLANNFLEFQGKRGELRNAIDGQFLTNRYNCKCLFPPTPFPTSGTLLTAATNAQLGLFNFVTAGDCAGATVPIPFVDQIGAISTPLIELNIVNISGTYSGQLNVVVSPGKEMIGPPQSVIRIPVAVQIDSGSGPPYKLDGCSISNGIPTVGLCPTGQYSIGYDANGTLQCAP